MGEGCTDGITYLLQGEKAGFYYNKNKGAAIVYAAQVSYRHPEIMAVLVHLLTITRACKRAGCSKKLPIDGRYVKESPSVVDKTRRH